MFDLIEPSVTPFMEKDLVKKIERCYRICYKSEHHIKEGSEKFLSTIIHHTEGNPHWSPLEHARIVLELDILSLEMLKNWEEDRGLRFMIFDPLNSRVTANFRTLQEFVKYKTNDRGTVMIQSKVAKALAEKYPYVFSKEYADYLEEIEKTLAGYIGFRYCEAYCKILQEAEDYRTYHIVTTRDILQELARHRSLSFSVESTRYCNYGKKGMLFTIPRPYEWAHEVVAEVHKDTFDSTEYLQSPEAKSFVATCTAASSQYDYLIENGVKPQVARMVLPGALKSEMIITGTYFAWAAFLKLRCDKNAHPQIRFLADIIKEDIGDKVSDIL